MTAGHALCARAGQRRIRVTHAHATAGRTHRAHGIEGEAAFLATVMAEPGNSAVWSGGATQPSRDGPSNTPAIISPTTWG